MTLPPAVAPVLERTIHPGVGAVPFAAPAAGRRREPTIVYAGRVTAAKGAEIAVHALAALRRRHGLQARLVLAGHCEREMARRIGRASRAGWASAPAVELAGALDTEALGRASRRAHAVVVPTRHARGVRPRVRRGCAGARAGGGRAGRRDPGGAARRRARAPVPAGDADGVRGRPGRDARRPGARAQARAERAFRHAQQFSVERFVDRARRPSSRRRPRVLGRGAG